VAAQVEPTDPRLAAALRELAAADTGTLTETAQITVEPAEPERPVGTWGELADLLVANRQLLGADFAAALADVHAAANTPLPLAADADEPDDPWAR
jgi:hypothetical protein